MSSIKHEVSLFSAFNSGFLTKKTFYYWVAFYETSKRHPNIKSAICIAQIL